MKTSAIFSDCRSYRYALWREWSDTKKFVMFIGLNPSTADEYTDDPTIRRCIGFTKDLGFSAMVMTNLFAFRATKPEDMKASPNPIGKENDKYLIEIANEAAIVIAAWGTHEIYLARN
jgi:hypothetical protein